MLATQSEPGADYHDYYQLHLRPGPYSGFFLVTGGLSRLMPVEVAGKLALSLYILLLSWLVLSASLPAESGNPRWGLLLVYPFAFNQQYFLGFVSYLYALPILILALEAHRALMKGKPGTRSIAVYALWTLALFFSHPFGFLVYLGFAALQTLLAWRKQENTSAGLMAFTLSLALFGSWLLSSAQMGEGPFRWNLTLERTIAGFLCMFTGMRWMDGIEAPTVVLWLAIGVLVVATALNRREGLRSRYLLFFMITVVGVFAAPFSKGTYTFINLRLAPVAFLFLAMWAGRVRFKGAWRLALVGLVGAIVVLSIQKQGRLSNEMEEILPLIESLPPKANILPLNFDNDSPELERWLFDPHLHVHDYYHLLVGGGYNPHFLRAPIHPVRIKPEVLRRSPGPGEYYPHLFRWEHHASSFQFFLTRRPPSVFVDYLDNYAEPVDASGEWQLFKRRSGW